MIGPLLFLSVVGDPHPRPLPLKEGEGGPTDRPVRDEIR